MTNLLVSIIIPVKNPGLFTENCLRSIKAQSYKNIEIILIAGNSTNITKELIEKYKVKVCYYNPKVPKGFFDAPHRRNYGVKKAKGTFVYYLDDDMELPENLIREA